MALQVSQATVSRLIAEADEQIIRLGSARSTRYAAVRRLFGAGFSIPIHAVDEGGMTKRIAHLHGLEDGSFLIAGRDLPAWLKGNDGNGVFPGLPYFLDDLRPSGFLGRLFSRRVSASWGFPEDTRDWTEEQLGRCLLHAGEMLAGNLVLGDAAAGRLQVWHSERVRDPKREYPLLAESVLAGEVPGSSVAGEQPKFTAWRKEAGHVIVKFSPSGENPEARRWRDLLFAEHHAQEALQAHGIPAARTRLFSAAGRVFLESARFDRAGTHGRRPMISLAAIDAEFTGTGRDWTRAAEALHARGLIDDVTLRRIAWLQLFGTLIGNSDMHFGNLSLAPCGDFFTLLPVYDMLPMALAPRHGDLPSSLPSSPDPPSAYAHLRPEVADAVADYRNRIQRDARVSAEFPRDQAGSR
jgi:hypothetical protein